MVIIEDNCGITICTHEGMNHFHHECGGGSAEQYEAGLKLQEQYEEEGNIVDVDTLTGPPWGGEYIEIHIPSVEEQHYSLKDFWKR